jgi:hypothetical protein
MGAGYSGAEVSRRWQKTGAGEFSMVKLVIMIEPPEDPGALEASWPRFLRLVESMPGLRREATSRMEVKLFGSARLERIHELFFDSLDAARNAMASAPGREAGARLQAMTGGKVSLFLANHNEDDIANIQKHLAQKAHGGTEETNPH